MITLRREMILYALFSDKIMDAPLVAAHALLRIA